MLTNVPNESVSNRSLKQHTDAVSYLIAKHITIKPHLHEA